MNQNRITTILLAGFILIGLIVCGVIGYLNDSGRVSPNKAEADDFMATDTPAAIDLVYCSSPASLCIISFGQDNAGNMLIVIRNKIPGLDEFYAKLDPAEPSNLYPCQKVQFASDIYYCLGSLIPDGTMVTMRVYSKSDDQLIASGRIPVSTVATPTPNKTITPTKAITPTKTVTPTTASKPTGTMTPSATKTSQAYPNP
jgi:hypothetical protein